MIDVFVGAIALSTLFNILISMAPRWRIPHAPRSTSNSSKDGYHSADSGDSGYEDARTNQPPAETAQRRNSYLNVAKKSANPPEVYKIGSKEAVADWGRRFAHYHHLMGNTIDTLVTHAAGFIDPILSGELLQNFQDPDSMAISMEWPDFLVWLESRAVSIPPEQTALTDIRSLKFRTKEQFIDSINTARGIIKRAKPDSAFFISPMVLVDFICAGLVRDGKSVLASEARTMPGAANSPWTDSNAFLTNLSQLSLKHPTQFTNPPADMPNPPLKRQQQQQSADRSGKKQRGITFPKDNTGRPTTIGYANREERQWCDQRAREIKGDVCYRCKQDGHKAQTCKMPATSG